VHLDRLRDPHPGRKSSGSRDHERHPEDLGVEASAVLDQPVLPERLAVVRRDRDDALLRPSVDPVLERRAEQQVGVRHLAVVEREQEVEAGRRDPEATGQVALKAVQGVVVRSQREIDGSAGEPGQVWPYPRRSGLRLESGPVSIDPGEGSFAVRPVRLREVEKEEERTVVVPTEQLPDRCDERTLVVERPGFVEAPDEPGARARDRARHSRPGRPCDSRPRRTAPRGSEGRFASG
jgi:hypothetical protein